MITVQDYAIQRGCSRQAVYSMINKYHLPTEKGISHGKSTQFLPDETVEKLNQLIRPTSKEVATLSDSIQMELMERETKLKDETTLAKNETILAKNETIQEIKVTRLEMLARIEKIAHDFERQLSDERTKFSSERETLLREKSEKDLAISALRLENEQLRQQIGALSKELERIKAHPIKSACAIIKENRNGTSAESNQGGSR